MSIWWSCQEGFAAHHTRRCLLQGSWQTLMSKLHTPPSSTLGLLVANGLIAPEVWLERDMSNTLLLYHPVPCLRALLAFGQGQSQAVLSAGEQAACIQQHVTQQVTYEACKHWHLSSIHLPAPHTHCSTSDSLLQAHLWQTELEAQYTLRRREHPDAAAWLPGLAEQLALMAELKKVFRSRFSAAHSVTVPLSNEAKEAHQEPSPSAPKERPETSSADATAEQLSRNTAFPGASPATAADMLSIATSPSGFTSRGEGRQEQPPPWNDTPLSMPSRAVSPAVGADASLKSDSVVGVEAGQLDVSAPKIGTPAPLRSPPRTRLPEVGSSVYTQQGLQTVLGSFVYMPADDNQLPSMHNSMVAGMEEVQIACSRPAHKCRSGC